MKNELLASNIQKHISLEPREKQFFHSLLKEKQVFRKEYILTEGQYCKNISFVNSGILRAFFNHEGKESTIMFARKNWWITDMPCFVSNQPAMVNIIAIADSSILQLSKENMDLLLLEIPKFERFFRIIFQNAYVREQLRTIQNLTLTAEERYDIFQKKYPEIVAQVTQKQIASYLGITPEFLSMIRAKKARK